VTDILMPALSPTMEEGTLTKWHIKAGDTVKAGDVIAEIETDKATMEVEAVDEGEVAEILVAEGSENVKVNTPIARLAGEIGAAAPAPSNPASQASVPSEGGQSPAQSPPAGGSTREAGEGAPAAALKDPEIPADAKLVKTTIRDALRDAMAEEMRRDEGVFLIGEEVAQYQGAYKVSRELLQEFGDKRVVDTPITEHGFAGLGVGAAMAGLKPIVEFMTFNFAMQAIDHIINSAAKTLYMSGGQIRASIVFRGPNGAASRVGAQHSQDYSAWYAQVPGLKVIAPYDAADAKGLLKSAIRDPNPVVFLEHEMMYGLEFDVPEVEDWLVPIGKAKVRREGTDVTITAHSRMVGFALQAAEQLAGEGISCEVVDLRTLRPHDMSAMLASVKKTRRVLVIEEAGRGTSIGGDIIAELQESAFHLLDHPIRWVAGAPVPMPYNRNLERMAIPTRETIADAVAEMMPPERLRKSA